jgi:hypothetical protein
MAINGRKAISHTTHKAFTADNSHWTENEGKERCAVIIRNPLVRDIMTPQNNGSKMMWPDRPLPNNI